MNKREANYDLLRVVCSIAVVSIHVSATYMNALKGTGFSELTYSDGILTSCLYNSLSRFAVSCFVMLSGAFVLDNERNSDYKYFYRKTLKNIGISTLIFSLFYFLYSFLQAGMSIAVKEKETAVLLTPIKNSIMGKPFYHIWYLYMMIGVYLLVPIIFLFRNSIEEKTFRKFAWVFLVISTVCLWTSSAKLEYDIGTSFKYVGYFIIGYVIRKSTYNKKSNVKGILLIVSGIAVELANAYLRYMQVTDKLPGRYSKLSLLSPGCPLIVISSVMLFAGFSYLSVNVKLKKLSDLTFLIYLFHAGIWDISTKLAGKFLNAYSNKIVIPLGIIIVFILSAAASKIYSIVWAKIEEKLKISDKICRLLKL